MLKKPFSKMAEKQKKAMDEANNKRLMDLKEYLDPEEILEAHVQSILVSPGLLVTAQHGLLAATDRRVLLYRQKTFNSEIESYQYSDIRSIEWKKLRFAGHQIEYNASGVKYTIVVPTNVPQYDVKQLVEAVRSKIDKTEITSRSNQKAIRHGTLMLARIIGAIIGFILLVLISAGLSGLIKGC